MNQQTPREGSPNWLPRVKAMILIKCGEGIEKVYIFSSLLALKTETGDVNRYGAE